MVEKGLSVCHLGSCLHFYSVSSGFIEEAVYDGVAVLCLRKDALVGLYDKGHSVLFKPSVGILRTKLLEKALEDRPDLKYISDVAPDNYETLKKKFGLRVFATPKKMGAQTSEANVNAGLAAARQIVSYFETGNTRFQVNK